MKPLIYFAALLIVAVQGCKPTASKPEAIEIALKSEGDTYSADLYLFDSPGLKTAYDGLFGYEIKFEIGLITFHGKEFEYPTRVHANKAINCDAKLGCSLQLAPSIVLNQGDTAFQTKGELSINLISRNPELNRGVNTEFMDADDYRLEEGDETFQIAFDSQYRKTVNTISLNFDVAVKYDSLNNIAGIILTSKDPQYAKLGEGHYYLGT